MLFKHSGLIQHNVGEGEAAFDWRGKQSHETMVTSENICNQSLFIEPVKWMADSISEPSGKVNIIGSQRIS